MANFNGNGAGSNQVGTLDGQRGSVLNFYLQNLVNQVDVANVQGMANFQGNGAGSNHVGTLNGQRGSILNFGLQNLVNEVDVANV